MKFHFIYRTCLIIIRSFSSNEVIYWTPEQARTCMSKLYFFLLTCVISVLAVFTGTSLHFIEIGGVTYRTCLSNYAQLYSSYLGEQCIPCQSEPVKEITLILWTCVRKSRRVSDCVSFVYLQWADFKRHLASFWEKAPPSKPPPPPAPQVFRSPTCRCSNTHADDCFPPPVFPRRVGISITEKKNIFNLPAFHNLPTYGFKRFRCKCMC